MKKVILILGFIFISISHLYAQSYPVGMFIDQNSSSALDSMAQGGINFVFASKYVGLNNSPDWYGTLIKNADDHDINIIANVRFESVDYDGPYSVEDSSISYIGTNNEFQQLKNAVKSILLIQQSLLDNNEIDSLRIRGWYIADEPFARRKDASKTNTPIPQLKKYTDSLKTFLDNWSDNLPSYPHQKLHLTEGASIWNVLNPNPNELFVQQDYSEYAESFDVLHIFYYGYPVNKDHTNLYDYKSFDIPNEIWPRGWDPGHVNTSIEEATIRALPLIKQKAQFDLSNYENKEIQMILVLGEEKPSLDGEGGRDYDTYEPNYLVSHGMTHAAIRKAYEIGFDGLSFFHWKLGDETRDDAYYNWESTNFNYKEAVSTEVQDRDWLVTSLTASSGAEHRTYLSDRGKTTVTLNGPDCYGVGQCPAAGNNEHHSSKIANLATGDLFGEEDNDYTYVINNASNRKSIADGDDELIYLTNNSNYWISEKTHVDSTFGDVLDVSLSPQTDDSLLAVTSGDFDGDGDSEVVTVIQEVVTYHHGVPFTFNTSIYSNFDGSTLKGNLLKSFSGVFKVSLASGDFTSSGRDQLILAMYDEINNDLFIYMADIALGEDPDANIITSNTSAVLYVNDFAVGDFDGDYKEELATSFRNGTGTYGHLTVSSPKPGGALGNPSWGPNRIWQTTSGTHEIVTAIAAGDFYNERKEHLITAIWDSDINESHFYQSIPTFNETDDSWDGDPTNTAFIYSSTYWHATAMAAGSFRESLPGGASKIAAQENENDHAEPSQYSLAQNYPNPFNPVTHINYTLPQTQNVKLQVFDVLGRLIATLVNERKQSGTHFVNFDASTLSSGVYIYKLEAGPFTQTKKFTLIK